MTSTSQKRAIFALITLGSSLVSPLVAQAEFSSSLGPTPYTPQAYIQPKYDAFDSDYYRKVPLTEPDTDTPPIADFTVFNNESGLQSQVRGTTATRFTFDAGNSNDNETAANRLEARWDFENDGKLDSYFSRTKAIQHTFAKPGIYTVKVEILDTDGNVSSTTHTITVATNTPPTPNFIVTKLVGSDQTVFNFDTSRSRDDQYLSYSLKYRFDWNSDGKWDTKYEQKTNWNHRFDIAGSHLVTMQVKDPEGATAEAQANVTTSNNTAPTANFTIKSLPDSQAGGYLFDASASQDAETVHRFLQFRWDLNYNGPNDIIYDTSWSTSDKFSGYYSVGGTKVVKLEVKDENGEISTAYAQFTVTQVQRYGASLR